MAKLTDIQIDTINYPLFEQRRRHKREPGVFTDAIKAVGGDVLDGELNASFKRLEMNPKGICMTPLGTALALSLLADSTGCWHNLNDGQKVLNWLLALNEQAFNGSLSAKRVHGFWAMYQVLTEQGLSNPLLDEIALALQNRNRASTCYPTAPFHPYYPNKESLHDWL